MKNAVAGATVAMALLASAGAYGDEHLERRMTVGGVEVERLEVPIDAVVVGDPAVVATTVVNATTLVLTAKAAGRSEVLLLDDAATILARWSVSVADNGPVVYRGTAPERLTCTPLCGPSAVPAP